MTKINVIKRLRGTQGFKRFSRDGFLSRLEDKSRRYYNKGEIKDFEGTECEWPLFYIFLIIDGVFKNHTEQVEEYQIELRKCMYTDKNGGKLCYRIIPNYAELNSHCTLDPVVAMYFAPDGEGSFLRAPSQSLFLWGQSLFIIAQLLTAGLLHVNELDPVRRYLPSYNRPRKGGRYSAFQVCDSMPDINMCFIEINQKKYVNILSLQLFIYI